MDGYHPAFAELAEQLRLQQQARDLGLARAASMAAQAKAKAENDTPNERNV